MFRRRRRNDDRADPRDAGRPPDEQSGDRPAGASEGSEGPGDDPRPSATARAEGPWDVAEVGESAAEGRVDLGGMWVPGVEGMELRVELDEATGRIEAVTVVLADSALQVMPFAAPRSEGIWDEVRAELAAGITAQGGAASEHEGALGTELVAHVPVALPDGSVAAQPVRFVGVDGPRWFLRGALTGAAYDDPAAAAALEALFRDVVVVRGPEAMPPREPIPLRLPPDAQAAGEGALPPGAGPQRPPLSPFERGPEITEVR